MASESRQSAPPDGAQAAESDPTLDDAPPPWAAHATADGAERAMAELEPLIAMAQAGDAEALAHIDAMAEGAPVGSHWWHILRRTGNGGSEVATALGLNRWSRPIDWYQLKLGEVAPFGGNERTKWGKRLEPVIAGEYADRHPEVALLDPRETRRHPRHYWLIESVDRLGALVTPENLSLDVDRVVEIKARGGRAAEQYGERRDSIPYPDLCQLAWYMAGRDLERGDLAVLFDTNQYREFQVERDRELEAYLLEEIERLWRKHIVARVPPDADGSDSFARYLRERFAKTSGQIVEVDDPALAADLASLRQIRALERFLESARPTLEQRIQDRIGPADGIMLDGHKVTYRFDKRGRVDSSRLIKALAARLELTGDDLRELEDAHRYPAPRRFLLPRGWSKDPITTDDLRGLPNVQRALEEPPSKP